MKLSFLDPEAIHLSKVMSSGMWMTIDNHDRFCFKAVVPRSFPISEPGRYIGFLGGNGKDIGTAEDIEKLDKVSRCIVKEEPDDRYFISMYSTDKTSRT